MTDIEIEIYTDGSCLMSDPQRPGGWGYSIYMREGDKSTLIVDGSGSTSHTTNIKMELMAIVHAFNMLNKIVLYENIVELLETKINVYTDSEWTVKCMTDPTWTCTKNHVMRKILHEFMKKYDVGYNWVKGHSSDAKNEKAHRLAKQEMQKEHGNNN